MTTKQDIDAETRRLQRTTYHMHLLTGIGTSALLAYTCFAGSLTEAWLGVIAVILAQRLTP